MTRQVLNRGTIANDGTGDTLRGAALKIEQNIIEIYNKLGDGDALTPLIDFDSSGIIFKDSAGGSFSSRIGVVAPTASNLIYVPNASGQLVMDAATQTLTNKTLTSAVLTTPQINDTSANHQYVVAVSELAADRTVTLPLLGAADEFTFNSHTQTLVNKTLTAPRIDNIRMGDGDGILDSAGNEQLLFVADSSSPVNYLRITSGRTNVAPILKAVGESTTSLSLQGSGNGAVQVDSKLVLGNDTIGSNGALNLNNPVTIIAKTSAGAYTLANGTQTGEIKYITNTQNHNAVITPANLSGYSTITLGLNDSVMLMYLATGTTWVIINNQDATLA
jgi:hypothetical protein|tara:strand:+ start:568 stop:1566 length:999 start_codon:yes stop_codon:yes gene_type:complete